MSDVSQGPGWWIASDGRWYPPEQHPSVREQLAAAPSRAGADGGAYASGTFGGAGGYDPATAGVGHRPAQTGPYGQVPPFGQAGSYGSAGVGAPFQGRSGFDSLPALGESRPYGSHSPGGIGTAVPYGAGYGNGAGPYGVGTTPYGAGPASYGSGFVAGSGGARRWSRRRVATVLVATLLVIGGAVGALFGTGVVSLASAGIPLGSGTATITWPTSTAKSSNGVPPATQFSGTVMGKHVEGTGQFNAQFLYLFATAPNSSTLGTLPAQIPVYDITGTMDSTYFTVNISILKSDLQKAINNSANASLSRLEVSGRYGSEKITGELTPAGNPNAADPPMHMDATIGSVHVVGTIVTPSGTNKATATFTVS